MKEEKIKVVLVEAGMNARCEEIGSSLSDMQKTVGGYIEAIYPFDDEAAIVCNEEGKINGLPLNRALYDDEGNIVDVIAGTFFVCGLTEDSFGSLTQEQAEKYTQMFLQPELVVMNDGRLVVIRI